MARPPSAPRLALYAGGMLGPFGSGVLAVLIPQIRDDFATTTGAATAGITVYLAPFAALQVVSGTLGERWGMVRTVRGAYAAYAVVSLLTVLAPTIGVFLVGRALQGCVNAFLSPLLLSAVAASAPPGRVGRLVGTFMAVQTAGVVLSPLVGGLAGEVDWRLAFIGPAVLAVGLALLPLPAAAATRRQPPPLRSALTRGVARLSAAAFIAYLAVSGPTFLVALRAGDELGASSTVRGVLVAGFGLAGIVSGRPAGLAADRFGRGATAAAGAVLCAVALPLAGVAGTLAGLAAAWTVTGVGSAFVWAGLSSLAVEAAPENRAGATSLYSAFRFAGLALAPVVWLPLYHDAAALPFAAAGCLCVVVSGMAWRGGADGG
jgi:MFS family permease